MQCTHSLAPKISTFTQMAEAAGRRRAGVCEAWGGGVMGGCNHDLRRSEVVARGLQGLVQRIAGVGSGEGVAGSGEGVVGRRGQVPARGHSHRVHCGCQLRGAQQHVSPGAPPHPTISGSPRPVASPLPPFSQDPAGALPSRVWRLLWDPQPPGACGGTAVSRETHSCAHPHPHPHPHPTSPLSSRLTDVECVQLVLVPLLGGSLLRRRNICAHRAVWRGVAGSAAAIAAAAAVTSVAARPGRCGARGRRAGVQREPVAARVRGNDTSVKTPVPGWSEPRASVRPAQLRMATSS